MLIGGVGGGGGGGGGVGGGGGACSSVQSPTLGMDSVSGDGIELDANDVTIGHLADGDDFLGMFE
jgi:hypothetical protein